MGYFVATFIDAFKKEGNEMKSGSISLSSISVELLDKVVEEVARRTTVRMSRSKAVKLVLEEFVGETDKVDTYVPANKKGVPILDEEISQEEYREKLSDLLARELGVVVETKEAN